MRFKIPVVILLLAMSIKGFAYPEFLGPVVSYQKSGRHVDFKCSNGYVRITMLHDDLIRVQMDRKPVEESTLSYAVIKSEWPVCEFDLSESDSALLIRTHALVLAVGKTPCRLRFLNHEARVLNADDPAFGMGWDGDRVQCWKTMPDQEAYYGLGQKNGGFNRWGRGYINWNVDFPGYDDRKDPLYQSHPFFMGLKDGRAYGIFFDNTYRSEFQFRVGTDRFYTFWAEDGVMDYYFFYGPSMKTVLSRYTELTGRMPIPPKWALGYQQCRYSYYPESEVRALAQTFRDKQFPCDVLYFDIHYMEGYRCFTWDKERFPDPRKLLEDLESMGFKTVVIIDPGIKVDPGYRVHDSGLAGGHFVAFPDGSKYIGEVWPGKCYFPDFTQASTRTWWGDLYRGLLNDGIDGFWNDMNEPAAWGGTFPDLVLFNELGGPVTHRKIHNVYGMQMARATYEGLRKLEPEKRPFVLTRAGYSGVQRYAAVWHGDNIANWQHLRLSMTLSLGLSMAGVPFTGFDIGGFIDDSSPELFARWLQLGVYSPLCRNHTAWGTGDQEPWCFGDDFETINRRTLETRYQIMPYLYDAFRISSVSGLPVMRPMVLQYPNDPATYNMDRQYMLGEDLLVAPVLEDGDRLRKVYLPEGIWFDRAENHQYAGPAWVNVDAPLDRIPVLARGGSVIPQQQSELYIGQLEHPALILDVYPVHGSFEDSLYEDEGEGWGFEMGESRLTRFNITAQKNQTEFALDRISKTDPLPDKRDLIVRWNGIMDSPKSIRADGKTILNVNSKKLLDNRKNVWYFDASMKRIVIYTVDDGKLNIHIEHGS